MPHRAAHFPQTRIRLPPRALEKVEQHTLHAPGVGARLELEGLGGVEHVHQLAVDVELQLTVRVVADSHRPAVLVAGEPGKFALVETAFAGGPVHDLQFLRPAGRGSQQPFPPGARFLEIAAGNESIERERGVANPAGAIVPVAHAADRFRQRGGRSRQDAAGREIREQLERNQRARHRLVPRPLDGAPRRPHPLQVFAGPQQVLGFAIDDVRPVRLAPAHHEGDRLAGTHHEVAAGGEVLAAQRHVGAQQHLIGPDDGAQPIGAAPHPRHGAAVVEPEQDLGLHFDGTGFAAHQAHQVDLVLVRRLRHEVGEGHGSAGGLEPCLQDRGARKIAARHSRPGFGRADDPAAVLDAPQERGETGGRIEARQAQPIDRAVAVHERRGARIADQSVVFDQARHLWADCLGKGRALSHPRRPRPRRGRRKDLNLLRLREFRISQIEAPDWPRRRL